MGLSVPKIGELPTIYGQGLNTPVVGFPSFEVASNPMTLAGLTQFVYTGTGTNTVISVSNTYYQMTATTATKGTITGSLTDNNDGSFTNNTGSTKRIHGMISGSGGNSNNITMNISVGTDNSGSVAFWVDDLGTNQRDTTSNRYPFCIVYSLDLDNGKFVCPIVQNRNGTQNFTLLNLSHHVWSYD